MWSGLPRIVPVFKLKSHTLGTPSVLGIPGQLVILDKSVAKQAWRLFGRNCEEFAFCS